MSTDKQQRCERCVAFLPWLEIEEALQIGAVRFVPFAINSPAPELACLADSLKIILSSYRDIKNQPRAACTVAYLAGRKPHDKLSSEDTRVISRASTLLSLAAMAVNKYCTHSEPYANGTVFLPYFQHFTEPVDHIAIDSRRRDGSSMSGGWKHGKIHFTMPIECTLATRPVKVDTTFAKALEEAQADGSALGKRLPAAISFFGLANTDSGWMLPEAEVITSVAAFEQLVGAHTAQDLSKRIGSLLRPYGRRSVSDVLIARRSIWLGATYDKKRKTWLSDLVKAENEKRWSVHQKWAQEIHWLRSSFVHGGTLPKRDWGWSILEHLLMGAFVFPLLVKILLAKEDYYALTEADLCRCESIDPLLAHTNWFDSEGNSWMTGWQKTISDVTQKRRWQVVREKVKSSLNKNGGDS
ncbi:MAG: hypothetical protein GTO55_12130 [Armatimonadetes bacterium]|nr:hypothetical protein [Armatimonadota bacterium]NIM24960.1 hypothetical protein [Armatimonadota bacterium]NIM68846.1 hypothetical protein [Armatimonadota bacterium]NIM77083.1 hypothetical protein [Armatimonadota bacterium]NIN07053.1 hypothetical protein [Armatimonadota bacterium]